MGNDTLYALFKGERTDISTILRIAKAVHGALDEEEYWKLWMGFISIGIGK